MNDAIERLIDKHGPAAICTALEPMVSAERIARIDAVLAARLASVVTVVEDTYDPHNAAATIRTTEALGLQELHVVEPHERFSATQGVTRGAHKWIDLARWPSAEAAVAGLHARGFRVYATAPDAATSLSSPQRSALLRGSAKPALSISSPQRSALLRGPAKPALSIEDVDVTHPLAVMFGNEHDGLSPAAFAVCDATLTVPMFGFTESFNLSVTVGLAMSRLAARRRAYISAPGDLDAERRARLRARWFALRIRGVVGVLERALK